MKISIYILILALKNQNIINKIKKIRYKTNYIMKVIIYDNKLEIVNQQWIDKLGEDYTFRIYINKNISRIIQKEYELGTRFFILLLTSNQVLNNIEIFKFYSDTVFISPTSTATEVRQKNIKNLFFSVPDISSNQILGDLGSGFNLCVIYLDINDVFVQELVNIAIDNKYPVFDALESDLLTKTLSFDFFILISITNDIFDIVESSINSRRKPYYYYSIETLPPMNILISNVAVIYPLQTIYPQINSEWNEICRDPRFNLSDPAKSMIPILLQLNFNKLKKFGYISNQNKLNTYFESNIIQLPQKIFTPTCYPNVDTFIWLIDTKYKDSYTLYNTNYIINQSDKIIKILFTNNPEIYISDYYEKNIRGFILDYPSIKIKKIQNCVYPDAIFICVRATDLSIYQPNYYFSITNYINLIKYNIIRFNSLVIIGSSNNINISNFQKILNKFNIQNIKINDLTQINNPIVYFLGTDEEFDKIKSLLFTVKIFRRIDEYLSLDQTNFLQKNNINYGNTLSNNSSQIFLDTQYSIQSVPKWVSKNTFFFNIPNIILNLNLGFLIKYGFLIGVSHS